MIAAIASSRGLSLSTRNSADFRGPESMVEIAPV
ncbi:type II toxin-antitoxin system VapC family toxin [Nocardia brasiliensis]|nr:type II toxin-antitoxin system VapC family toxin [Nocardia brasiliensis]